MSKQQKGIIVDASIAIKWLNPSEELSNFAEKILQDYLDGKIKLAIPEFFYYEIASGISKAIMRDYITAIEGQKAIDYILQLDIKTYPIPNVKIVYNIAQSYKRSIYDSIYIALAQIMGAEFWTADKKLYNAVSNKLQFVKWIEDYR